jgi:hypothetical protein
MEHQWNESDGEKPKYLERKLSQCPFFHHIHMDWPGDWLAANQLSTGAAYL